MGREERQQIAQETVAITSRGFFTRQGTTIKLAGADYDAVQVLSPAYFLDLEKDKDNLLAQAKANPAGAHFRVIDSDSFEAARGYDSALVMNFSNAVHIGGGFLSGANAQEEALCRNSTLYASISSRKAAEMYEYNRRHRSPVDSDYMLISPNVCVFRNGQGQLLDKPYLVGVVTMPAPNRNGRAHDVPQSELDQVMMSRLRKMLLAAVQNKYRTLVLGAWGCGVFGHSARRVARYFHDLFFEENFRLYFDTVTFAILRDPQKIREFKEIWR